MDTTLQEVIENGLNGLPEQPESFNWLAFLKDLAAGRKPTSKERVALNIWAGRWPTCACGQLCKSIPRSNLDGSPQDLHLKRLGLAFYHRIEIGNWTGAITAFREIEARTEQLLDQQEKQITHGIKQEGNSNSPSRTPVLAT